MDGESQHLVFQTAVEGLYLRGLKDRVTPALRAELREVGIDLDRTLLPAYPLAAWARSLRLAGTRLFPDRPADEGIAELGRLTITGMRETLLGRALFPMLKLLGPVRMLQRMTRSLQNGANFVETKLLRQQDNEAVIWFNHVAEEAFYRGLLDAGLVAAGAQRVEVEVEGREGQSRTYRLTWS